jgi:hypothetical protein
MNAHFTDVRFGAAAVSPAGFELPTADHSPLPGRWLIGALVVSAAVVALMLLRAHLVIAPETSGFAAALVLVAAPALGRFGLLRRPASPRQRRIAAFCEDGFLFLAISLLGVVASYPAAAATSGFADSTLAHADRLLHFDWLAWYRIVAGYRWLQRLETAAYAAIYVTPWILLGWFAATDRRREARMLLCTFWLAIVLTLAVFPLFPAQGPLAFLWHGPIPYMPTSALYQHQLIPALRAHHLAGIDLGALRGLVCAPSFHTAAAVVFIAAAWPVPWLRRLVIPLNLAMLAATPIEGTHYLSDMIAGLLVGLVAVLVVRAAANKPAGTLAAPSRLLVGAARVL